MAPITEAKLTKTRQQIELLLAKAESTNHPAEAELAQAQAEKLMVRYGFQRAEFNGDNRKAAKMVERRMDVPGMFHLGKAQAFTAIARAYQAVTVLQSKYSKGTTLYLIGEEGDVEDVLRMLNSMDVQAEHALAVWWADNKARYEGFRQEGWKARRQFIIGFGSGAAARVRESMVEAVAESKGNELVLASRLDKAVEYQRELYPATRTLNTRLHGGGHSAGVAGNKAGREAHLGKGAIGGTKALGK
jgi:hypothetical protein